MYWGKILLLLAIGIVCINARRIIKKQKKICQRPASAPPCNRALPPIEIPCSCKSIIEPSYGTIGSCACQNLFLDELLNYACADTYGILSPEVPIYGRVPAVKVPKIADFDCGVPVPAINLPSLYDFIEYPSCQAVPPCVGLPPCPCQGAMPQYQIIESPCCRTVQRPIVEYLIPEAPSPFLKVPYAEPYCLPAPKCPPHVAQLPPCGCSLPNIEYGCQMNMPCGCPTGLSSPCSCDGVKVSYGLPCGCQNHMNCGCQNPINCGCQNPINCGCQNAINCGCQNAINCGCQNAIPYGPELRMLEAPCPYQACQLSPVELPVFGYGCQSLPPPVVGCGGKYLRQITLQPPFL